MADDPTAGGDSSGLGGLFGGNSALGLGGLGSTNANNISQLLLQGGNAQSAGTVGSANAFSNLLGNLSTLPFLSSRSSFG